ncbi:carbohydrate binding domain-containing protein [Streptomyces sp. SJL17-1]|uniref:carbohydrate binding domain-containing protein n=1 Tax=Streptomyces sp. SJL17-1 TaxID=2967223 RepID=UPI002966FF89|nr:carbohydrate binding domain-containing protein [Streptomyces sp. SJL17-1]
MPNRRPTQVAPKEPQCQDHAGHDHALTPPGRYGPPRSHRRARIADRRSAAERRGRRARAGPRRPLRGRGAVRQPARGGIFTWGSDADDQPKLEFKERADAPEGSKVLQGSYDISGWGGLSHEYAVDQAPRDWTASKGIRFWWYGQNTAPLPPGSGKRINFEIKDGGANGGASELWTTSFTDDWEGWHLVEIPFSDFVYRADYQPVGGIDQVLGLNEMWGWALTLPTGAPGTFAVDGMELYGKADPALKAKVLTDAAVYPVDEGGTAQVKISVATTGSVPTEEPVTVEYRTGGGSARPARTTNRSPAPSPSRRAPPPASPVRSP